MNFKERICLPERLEGDSSKDQLEVANGSQGGHMRGGFWGDVENGVIYEEQVCHKNCLIIHLE